MRSVNAVAVGLAVLCVAAQAADLERGRLLYETRCGGCHADSVHGRAKRIAADCEAIRAEVVRWNAHLGGTWSRDEIDDVAAWLNQRYYRFPTRNGACAEPVAGAPDGVDG